MPEAKFDIGDWVRDNYSGKTGRVTARNLSPTDVDNLPNPTWYYSMDKIGWLYIPENDLEVL